MSTKANLDLGYVNKYMKLKFSMYLTSENKNVVGKIQFEGNDYIQFTPRPMITLEIFSEGDKKNTIWNANRILNFTKFSKFIFCKRLKEILENIKSEKDVYYLENGDLIINKEISSKMIEHIPVGQKMCTIMPTVVEDSQTHEKYEGIVFVINNSEYCNLTFEEAEYLYEYLLSIDIDTLSMTVINAYMTSNINQLINYVTNQGRIMHKGVMSKMKESINEIEKVRKQMSEKMKGEDNHE